MRYLSGVSTLAVDRERCSGCGTCLDVCPHAVLVLESRRVSIVDRDACMECGACQKNCPVGAITVQAGVGCAEAVINGLLGVRADESSCCCESRKSR